MFVKKIINQSQYRLSFILWLIALHSFAVGITLIFIPPDLLSKFGYNLVNERFFPSQGGVLHIVMCICYSLAALKLEKFKGLIILSITAKTLATVFLISYFIIVDQILVVLFSGIVDCLMAIAILFAYLSYKKTII